MKNQGCIILSLIGFLLFSCCGGYFVLSKGQEVNKDVDPDLSSTPPKPTNTPTENSISEIPTDPTDMEPEVVFTNQTSEDYAFTMQTGSPVTMMSWTHDCNWMGVAGQVFYDGSPVEDILVETGGILDGKEVLGLAITGFSTDYGSGGYEIQLSGQPIESVDSVWIQLKDNAGVELTRKYSLSSYDQCDQNLILANFVKTEDNPIITFYFPLFFR